MIGYQLDATTREFAALRGRALLLVLQVIVTALSLVFTLNDTVRSVNDLGLAASLSASDVSYFEMSYEDDESFTVPDELDELLAATLGGSTRDYSIVKSNFLPDEPLAAPVLVALGGFADAYDIDLDVGGAPIVLVGARVTGYDVGGTVELGGEQYPIAARLPAGSAYLDPWMGYETLDDTIVLLSTYEHFAQHTDPGVWQQELIGRTILFDATDARITAYVEAVSTSGGMRVIPQSLDSRVASVYETKTGKNAMFLLFFGCLLLVLLATITATVGSLVTSNLRRYAIERVYGAGLHHITVRVNLFLAFAFTGPAALIFTLFAVVAPNAEKFLPAALIVILAIHLALAARALWLLSRMSVTNLLRTE